MRYISIVHIKEGMVLAQPIYGGSLGILLGTGMTLSSFHIQRINQLGYAGVYISDEFSKDIQVKDIVPPNIRNNTIRAAMEMWQQAEGRNQQKNKGKTNRANQDKIIMPVIDALIANPRRLVELIDLKPEEHYLYFHAANAVILSLLIGVELGLSGLQLYELGLSALLHDVGNIFIPKVLLEKPGKLTPEEYETIRSHTDLGFEYLRENFEISIEGCMGALQHHENYDGSGYPTGLKKDKISIYGRIIAIADVYDALTSRRPYRDMMYPPQAMEYMNSKAGTMFDPGLLEVFQRVVPLYPTGLSVELDSGVRGVVAQNFIGAPDRPRVRLMNSNTDQALYVDLYGDEAYKDTKISSIIEAQ